MLVEKLEIVLAVFFTPHSFFPLLGWLSPWVQVIGGLVQQQNVAISHHGLQFVLSRFATGKHLWFYDLLVGFTSALHLKIAKFIVFGSMIKMSTLCHPMISYVQFHPSVVAVVSSAARATEARSSFMRQPPESSLTSIKLDGFIIPWISMALHGFPWISMVKVPRNQWNGIQLAGENRMLADGGVSRRKVIWATAPTWTALPGGNPPSSVQPGIRGVKNPSTAALRQWRFMLGFLGSHLHSSPHVQSSIHVNTAQQRWFSSCIPCPKTNDLINPPNGTSPSAILESHAILAT